MYFVFKLIILFVFFAIYQCKAYVLLSPSTTTTQQHDYNDHYNNNNIDENQLTELGVTQSSLHNNYMVVKPSEIKVPTTLQEIVNYIGADKLDHTAVLPINEVSQHTLTYTELSKLLAFWQWAKEQNFYEMQTDQPPSNTNYNFVIDN